MLASGGSHASPPITQQGGMGMIRRAIMVASAALLAAACVDGNSTDGMDVPSISEPRLTTAASSAELFHEQDQASFRLERVVIALSRGDVIAHYPHRYWKKWQYADLCNIDYGHNATLEWGSGPKEFGDWRSELGKIFHEAMKSRGTNVVGDPSRLFRVSEEALAAEYLVGARITDIRGNICHTHDYWTARPLKQSLGEFYVKVEWEVFSSLTQRVVYKFSTDGYAETKNPTRNGAVVAFMRAFRAAVERAAENADFHRILEPKTIQLAAQRPPDERLTLSGSPLYRTPVGAQIDKLIAATVTLESGTGHGSGFLITRDGYLLTNAHVVGDGKRVPVVFSTGIRVSGTVIRVARKRDVALVKIPIIAEHILPVLRNAAPRMAQTVYALGTPLKRELRATLTRGIVSSNRSIHGNSYIQADVAVTGGNSGGPLLDEYGNVVGISVAGYDAGQNLNLFIPIADALNALNLTVVAD